jgi:hypothetical protein
MRSKSTPSGAAVSGLIRIPPAEIALHGRTLREVVPTFLQWLAFSRRRSPNTVASYGHDLQSFLTFCARAGLEQPEAVTFEHIEFYLGWVQTERGLKASSANRHLHALRTFFQYLVRRRRLGYESGPRLLHATRAEEAARLSDRARAGARAQGARRGSFLAWPARSRRLWRRRC